MGARTGKTSMSNLTDIWLYLRNVEDALARSNLALRRSDRVIQTLDKLLVRKPPASVHLVPPGRRDFGG